MTLRSPTFGLATVLDGPSSLELFAGPAILNVDGKVSRCRARVQLTICPSVDVVVHLDELDPAQRWAAYQSREQPTLQLMGAVDTPPVGLVVVSPGDSSVRASLSGHGTLGDVQLSITRLSALWINLSEVEPSRDVTGPSADADRWARRATWDVGDWRVEIDQPSTLSTMLIDLRNSGGYRLTHVMAISRLDGSAFDHQVGLQVLQAVHLGVSFVLSRFAGPVALTGHRVDGSTAWVECGTPHVDPVTSAIGWWNPSTFQPLRDAVVPVIAALLDETRAGSAAFLVQSYLASWNQRARVEQRLMAGYAALEHLAWVRLVLENGGDPDRVDKKGSAWRVRRLLEAAKMPTALQTHQTALRTYAADEQLSDGPAAVAEVRHRITHPKTPRQIYDRKGLLFEACQATHHWLALTVLHWCGYHGLVVDQTRRGLASEAELVPWDIASQSSRS